MKRLYSLGFVAMGMWALVLCECGGREPEPSPLPLESCQVCDQSDAQTCNGKPSLCAKTGDSFCCVGG